MQPRLPSHALKTSRPHVSQRCSIQSSPPDRHHRRHSCRLLGPPLCPFATIHRPPSRMRTYLPAARGTCGAADMALDTASWKPAAEQSPAGDGACAAALAPAASGGSTPVSGPGERWSGCEHGRWCAAHVATRQARCCSSPGMSGSVRRGGSCSGGRQHGIVTTTCRPYALVGTLGEASRDEAHIAYTPVHAPPTTRPVSRTRWSKVPQNL